MKQGNPISLRIVSRQGIPLLATLLLFLIVFPQTFANAQSEDPAANPHTHQDPLPLAAGLCVTRAQNLFQNGEVNRAISLLEDFKKKKGSPPHYYIHFLLGNYYLALGQNRNAVVSFQASVQQNPAFYAGWLNLAKSLYESGLFARAGGAFEQGYKTSESPKPIHLYYAGICHFQADDPQKALAVFEHLIQTHPDKIRLEWKESLVNILFSLERYSQALPILEELAAKTRESQKKWQEILLYQYLNLKMEEKALTLAQILTRTDPLEPKWWKALCHLHLNRNQLKQALSALVIYGYLTPLTHEELMLAGDLYLGLEVPIKAARLYQTAMKKTWTPAQVLKISQAYVMGHDPDKALAWIEKGLTASPDIRLLGLKAQILYRQKKYAGAADAYERLIENLLAHPPGPDIPNQNTLGQAWLMLGYAAINQNDPDHTQLARAQKAFLMASGFKQQQGPARKALEQITIRQKHQKVKKAIHDTETSIKN